MVKLRLTQFGYPNTMPAVVLALDCLKVAVQGMQTVVSSDEWSRVSPTLEIARLCGPDSEECDTTGSARMGHEVGRVIYGKPGKETVRLHR